MTAPKKPQDHKPKNDGMLRAVIRGVKIEVSADALDDWELIEAIAAADSGDPAAAMQLPSVIRRLLGDHAYTELKDAVRDENGRVRAATMGEVLGEIFAELAPNS